MIRSLVAGLALAVACYIVFVTRIGPVVLVLTRTHGVHSGDSLAFPFVALAAAVTCPWHRLLESTTR